MVERKYVWLEIRKCLVKIVMLENVWFLKDGENFYMDRNILKLIFGEGGRGVDG